MTEIEAIMKIASELENIRISLSCINATLLFILFFKRCYSYTDEIKDAIKELISLIKSRR